MAFRYHAPTEAVSTVIALVNYESRQKAKDKGFEWDPVERLWVKWVPKSQVKAFLEECAQSFQAFVSSE